MTTTTTAQLLRVNPYCATDLDVEVKRLLGSGFSISDAHPNADNRSLLINEIDPAKVSWVTMLNQYEKSISGGDSFKRLTGIGCIRLDIRFLLAFLQNPHLIPEQLKQETSRNRNYLYSPGTLLKDPDGKECLMCLYWSKGDLKVGYIWPWHPADSFSLFAVLLLYI